MKAIICDIDGVLLHSNTLIEGADTFVNRILKQGNPLLFLTNFPSQTPQDLQNRLAQAGIHVKEDKFYTSSMATAAFLKRQSGKKAYVIGEGALVHALYSIGFTITDINPDFVVVGETRAYNWDMIQKASFFILECGARFVATNPDVAGQHGQPACGALCAPIERITGRKPFYIGKPSAWMMRAALNSIGVHSENAVIVGDNMRTDILAGVQAGMETVLVLTGATKGEDVPFFPYRPSHIFERAGDINIL